MAVTRRSFLSNAVSAAATVSIVPRHVVGGQGHTPPSEKLNIAGIGVGGRGFQDIRSVSSENIVALCDVDHRYAARAFEAYPNAKVYTDYRVMLEKQKDIDAVVIATPDHTHAVITIAALQAGKHVYCEKPLAHSVYECRRVAEVAKETGLATQMGNQGQASESARVVAEMLAAGAVGTVREIHAWSNRKRYIAPRGMARPKDTPPVPATLNWDLWLGPAQYRPYHPAYCPWKWRSWWDFGTGVLGDIGCHQLSALYKALNLGSPTSIESRSSSDQADEAVWKETAPIASITRYAFPATQARPGLTVTWWDGGMMPPRPAELEPKRSFGGGDGTMIIGDKGTMLGYRLIPEAKMQEFGKPEQTLSRSPGHHKEWLNACKGGPKPGSNFVDHAAPLAEVVMLGVAAVRARKKLEWDPKNMCFPNAPEADAFLNPPYREGWSL